MLQAPGPILAAAVLVAHADAVGPASQLGIGRAQADRVAVADLTSRGHPGLQVRGVAASEPVVVFNICHIGGQYTYSSPAQAHELKLIKCTVPGIQ